MPLHIDLTDTGQKDHFQIDAALQAIDELTENAPLDVAGDREAPGAALANLLTALATLGVITNSTAANPPDVSGARDAPEAALANLLTALDALGIITDSTSAS